MDREKVIKGLEICSDLEHYAQRCGECPYKSKITDFMCFKLLKDALALLKEQEAVVHPEPSCEMTYVTDCCCDLCGVQLIREDNFCRCCGKRIEWESR